MTPAEFFALLSFGFAIGLLGSALGVGGGVFMVPFLVLALKLPMHQAVAASLACIVATSCAVAAVNVERGLANIRLGVALELTTALGSIFGALAASSLPGGTVRGLFAWALFPLSALMMTKGLGLLPAAKARASLPATPFDGTFYDPAVSAQVSYKVRRMAPAAGVSFFAGSLSGLLGIGGGIIQVPMMNLACGVPMKAAAATSNFIIGVSAAASALVFFRRGLMPGEVAGAAVAGVLLGSFAGIRVLYRAKAEKLQALFGLLALLTGIMMLAG
jgi:uncharacterized membrane protein YfcA